MTNQRVVELLRKIGWDLQTANEAGLAGKVDDVKLVIHARKNKRIYITFDYLRGEQGQKVSRELRRNGGKIIQIRGGADKDEYRILGKILFHYPDWNSFLGNNSGVSVISDINKNCKNYTPQEYHQKYHRTDADQFTQYLKRRKQRTYHPRKHKRKPPPMEQAPLT